MKTTTPLDLSGRFFSSGGDGKVAGFAQQGCWLTCHDGERDMPKPFTKEEVAGNALLNAIKKTDVRKYLPETRTDPSDWKTGKSVEEIAKLMWDEKKVGYRSITADQLRKGDHFLIKEQNAVAFDPKLAWKEGDMIPDYVVSRADAAGSAADNNAISSWKDGVWTVVLIRPLGLTNPDDKALKEGGVYNVGFAVHDDNITTRGHHISFVKTLSLGAATKADINAVKLP
jgi:hypothetical protein